MLVVRLYSVLLFKKQIEYLRSQIVLDCYKLKIALRLQ
jgi:hypothetical protein